MTLKLNGSSSGHVNLDAKAAAASNTLTLPDTASGELVAADSSGHINLADSKMLKLGTGGDLTITHDGSDAKISNDTGAFVIQDSHAGANAVIIRKGGEVELLHNNVLACETSANGLAFPSGKGIDFSAHGNAGGMTAELLDDYEEGNFTPTVAGSSGTGTPAYSAQHGKYTKVGRLVSVVFDLNVSSWSGASGVLQVILPFANGSFAAGTYWYYSPVWHSIDTNFIGSTGNYRSGYMGQSSTALLPRIIGDTNNDAGMNVNTTGRIAGSMTYITDS